MKLRENARRVIGEDSGSESAFIGSRTRTLFYNYVSSVDFGMSFVTRIDVLIMSKIGCFT